MPVAPLRSIVAEHRPRAGVLVGLAAVLFAASVVWALAQRPRVVVCRAPRAQIVAPTTSPACDHAVKGTWVANEYRADQRDWVEHTIHIADLAPGTDLHEVDHVARVRSGNERGPTKLDCMPDAMEFKTVGRAELGGDQLGVYGTRLVSTSAACDGTSATYSLDAWTGTVSGNTFDAVNNDGNTAVNRPYRFHRISCE